MPMLFFVLAYVAPGCVLAVVMYRLIKVRKRVFVARMDTARTQALADAAREAARIAEELQIARQIEKIGAQLDAMIDCIGGDLRGDVRGDAGEPPRRGRHALPDESA
jgi:hypothetical protein